MNSSCDSASSLEKEKENQRLQDQEPASQVFQKRGREGNARCVGVRVPYITQSPAK